jgi:DNA polymerase
MRQQITFFGQIEGKQIWGRISTYGGKLVENATQGVAADVMAHGAANGVERGFEIFTLVHDQALALHKAGEHIDDFIAALVDLPPWADGLPIKCEGKIVPFYTKT